MQKHWFEYVKSCYDLVVESEGYTELILKHEVEAYIVHLMARNFNRVDIGDEAIAIQILSAINSCKREKLVEAADECLLIHSFPLKRKRWPSPSYYQDMGVTAYGMAGHMMEDQFVPASKILTAIFNKKFDSVPNII